MTELERLKYFEKHQTYPVPKLKDLMDKFPTPEKLPKKITWAIQFVSRPKITAIRKNCIYLDKLTIDEYEIKEGDIITIDYWDGDLYDVFEIDKEKRKLYIGLYKMGTNRFLKLGAEIMTVNFKIK